MILINSVNIESAKAQRLKVSQRKNVIPNIVFEPRRHEGHEDSQRKTAFPHNPNNRINPGSDDSGSDNIDLQTQWPMRTNHRRLFYISRF